MVAICSATSEAPDCTGWVVSEGKFYCRRCWSEGSSRQYG